MFPHCFLEIPFVFNFAGLVVLGGGARQGEENGGVFLILCFADASNPSVSKAPTASLQVFFHKASSALSKWLFVQAVTTRGERWGLG